MKSLLYCWDGIAVSVAAMIIMVTAIGLMVGVLEVAHAVRRIALVVGCMILLLILPPIMLGIWRTLSHWQCLGVILLTVGAVRVFSAMPGVRSKRSR